MEYLLEVQHLNKNLNTFALHDISFTLKPGFITGLIGQNGCGKTSLIKTILNLYEKDSGAVFVTGHSMETKKLLQKISLALFWMNVSLMQTPGLRRTPAASVLSIVDMITAYFWNSADVLMWTQRKIGKLSKGQKHVFSLPLHFPMTQKCFLWMNLRPDWILCFAKN